MFDQLSAPEIMKWVVLVFLAGFIGFFGKYLGRTVITLFQRKKEDAPSPPTLPGQASGTGDMPAQAQHGGIPDKAVSKDEQKLKKKALKAGAKRTKKGGT